MSEMKKIPTGLLEGDPSFVDILVFDGGPGTSPPNDRWIAETRVFLHVGHVMARGPTEEVAVHNLQQLILERTREQFSKLHLRLMR